MPVKDWLEWLAEDFTLFVIRDSFEGKLRSFSVVLMHDGVCISRYDTAHGYAHRDVLGCTLFDSDELLSGVQFCNSRLQGKL